MKKYNSYKDSGIEWMGVIPSNWKLIKNRYGFQKHKNGKNESDDTSVLSLTIKGVKVKTNLNFGKSTESYIGHQLVEEGDIVFTPRDFDQTPILSDVSKYNGCISNLYIVDKTKEDVLNHYVNYYWYGLKYSVDYFKNFSHGMRYSFNRFQFDEIPLLKPTLSEQQQIVSFLDTKTSLIDSLIEKTQRKIELLKEKRTSLINEVVTKGLNPNVEMRNSGVEWIGMIPIHWEIKMLKFVFRPIREKSESGNEELLSVLIRKGVVRRRDFIGNEENISRSETLEGYIKCRKNNLVNNIMKMGFYCMGISQYDGIVSPGYSVFEFITYDQNPKYWDYLLKTEKYVSEYRKLSKGIQESRMRLYDDYFLSINTVFPKKIEQDEIVEYLDEQTQMIDMTISIEEKRIELLKEYRQSLISEVVTGKRKVVE